MENRTDVDARREANSAFADLAVEPEQSAMVPAGQQQQTEPADDEPRRPRAKLVRDISPPDERAETLSLVRMSDEVDQLFGALAAAQANFGEIERVLRAEIKSQKANYEYDYAPLDKVLQAVRPHLSAQGLAVMQFPLATNNRVTVRTMLAHKSGQWIRNDLTVASEGNFPREIGSAITYARRYALQSMLGVAPNYDDDGGAASGDRSGPPRSAGRRRPADQNQPAPPEGQKPSGRPAQRPATPAASAVPQEPPPVAAVPAQPATAAPVPVGRVSELMERNGGMLATLETGYKASTRDPAIMQDLRGYRAVSATVRLHTRPSSDPKLYAPVIERAEIVKRDVAQGA